MPRPAKRLPDDGAVVEVTLHYAPTPSQGNGGQDEAVAAPRALVAGVTVSRDGPHFARLDGVAAGAHDNPAAGNRGPVGHGHPWEALSPPYIIFQ